MGTSDFEFDRATTLAAGAGAGEWVGQLDDQWRIGNGINGGLLMAIGASALRADLDEDGAHPDPLAFTAYFQSPSEPGPVTVRTEVLRVGRSMSTGQVTLVQADAEGMPHERMRALATFGDLTDREEPRLRSAPPPTMPPPEQCIGGGDETPDFLAHSTLLQRMDMRLDPASSGWLVGKPSHTGVLGGWLRLADGREPDVMSVLWALDALPPVAFDLGLMGWTPTLEFSAHLRRHPAPGWLQVQLTTENVAGGLMEEDARIWDSEGNLVALSRQLCGWRAPRG
ncbi:MAG TPA: thioesterase family protein [Dermatophilaceae bacterium]|jgi:acyl-CoA thioesterase|nr:thioesterase family protein [Dermatophilaceae bacterium]HOA56405.1 thioesterase family protein [Dermatophilaceae bacterium]HPV80715.1 thioesterase family protein [Dermatophilaceae bacterium]HPZ67630.1 thioesterase family protein [Dermatophilaceae bacterium]HQD00097.1 thioesterase family protein [Dermatophilaceae bacterium]